MSKTSKSVFSSNKGQGMSLNTVIIAIIVLVVLVVLVMIFTGYFGKIFAPGVQNCETALAGKCQVSCAAGETKVASYTDDAAAIKGGCTAGTRACCKVPII